MKTKNLKQVDQDGNECEGVLVLVPKKVNPYNGGFVMLSQTAALQLAQDKILIGGDFRVLLQILGSCEFENRLTVKQAEIGKALGINKSNISRSITRLCDRGYIIKRKEGRDVLITVSTSLSWKGSGRSLAKHLGSNPHEETPQFQYDAIAKRIEQRKAARHQQLELTMDKQTEVGCAK